MLLLLLPLLPPTRFFTFCKMLFMLSCVDEEGGAKGGKAGEVYE